MTRRPITNGPATPTFHGTAGVLNFIGNVKSNPKSWQGVDSNLRQAIEAAAREWGGGVVASAGKEDHYINGRRTPNHSFGYAADVGLYTKDGKLLNRVNDPVTAPEYAAFAKIVDDKLQAIAPGKKMRSGAFFGGGKYAPDSEHMDVTPGASTSEGDVRRGFRPGNVWGLPAGFPQIPEAEDRYKSQSRLNNATPRDEWRTPPTEQQWSVRAFPESAPTSFLGFGGQEQAAPRVPGASPLPAGAPAVPPQIGSDTGFMGFGPPGPPPSSMTLDNTAPFSLPGQQEGMGAFSGVSTRPQAPPRVRSTGFAAPGLQPSLAALSSAITRPGPLHTAFSLPGVQQAMGALSTAQTRPAPQRAPTAFPTMPNALPRSISPLSPPTMNDAPTYSPQRGWTASPIPSFSQEAPPAPSRGYGTAPMSDFRAPPRSTPAPSPQRGWVASGIPSFASPSAPSNYGAAPMSDFRSQPSDLQAGTGSFARNFTQPAPTVQQHAPSAPAAPTYRSITNPAFSSAQAQVAAARAAQQAAMTPSVGGLSGWGTMAAAGPAGPLSNDSLKAALAAAEARLKTVPQYKQVAVPSRSRSPAPVSSGPVVAHPPSYSQSGGSGGWTGSSNGLGNPFTQAGMSYSTTLPSGAQSWTNGLSINGNQQFFSGDAPSNAFGGMGFGNPFSGLAKALGF